MILLKHRWNSEHRIYIEKHFVEWMHLLSLPLCDSSDRIIIHWVLVLIGKSTHMETRTNWKCCTMFLGVIMSVCLFIKCPYLCSAAIYRGMYLKLFLFIRFSLVFIRWHYVWSTNDGWSTATTESERLCHAHVLLPHVQWIRISLLFVIIIWHKYSILLIYTDWFSITVQKLLWFFITNKRTILTVAGTKTFYVFLVFFARN